MIAQNLEALHVHRFFLVAEKAEPLISAAHKLAVAAVEAKGGAE